MLKQVIGGCAAFLVMAACVFTANAAPGLERMLARQPAPVQKTIRAQLGDGKLRSIDKDNEDGEITYDVEVVRQGKTRSFTVGADGELLDTEVFLDELPVVLQQAIKKKIGGATLGEIDKSVDDGETNYDVEMMNGGKTRSFTIDATGKLTDEEVFLTELPESFQKAIQKEAGSGTVDEITRSFEEAGIFYDVDVIENGKTRTLTFDSKGVLSSKEEEVMLSEISEAAQKQIQTLSTNGKLVSVAKVTEDAAVSLDVDIRQNGKVTSYTLSVDGKVLPSDAQ